MDACHCWSRPVSCAHVDKIAFQLGPLTVHWYGVLVAVGFMAGLWTASRRGLRYGVAPEQVMDLGPWLVVGTLVGARSLYVISYWKEEFADRAWTEIFMVHHGGLVFYGGFIGASLAVLLYFLWKKLPVWKMADVLAPSIALGSFFGRLGCFMNGCCYGRECDLPWAVQFTDAQRADGVSVHPSQIYDSLLNLGLYLGLVWLYRHKRFDGQVFAGFMIGYALMRGFVELFRGDYPVRYLGGLTPAQLISAAILAGGLILIWKLPRRLSGAAGGSQ